MAPNSLPVAMACYTRDALPPHDVLAFAASLEQSAFPHLATGSAADLLLVCERPPLALAAAHCQLALPFLIRQQEYKGYKVGIYHELIDEYLFPFCSNNIGDIFMMFHNLF